MKNIDNFVKENINKLKSYKKVRNSVAIYKV